MKVFVKDAPLGSNAVNALDCVNVLENVFDCENMFDYVNALENVFDCVNVSVGGRHSSIDFL